MQRRLLFIMFTYLVVDLLANTIMLPWLPTIIREMCEQDTTLVAVREFFHKRILGVPEGEKLSSRDASFIGSISSSLMALAQYVSSSTAGSMSDSFGRRPVLLALHLMGLASYLLWAASGASFAFFVVARILSGVSRANVGVLSAMVSDVSDKDYRTRGMASIGIAYSIAFLVGPPASAWFFARFLFNSSDDKSGVDVLGPHLGLVAATITGVNFACLYYGFPETAKFKEAGINVSGNKEKRTSWKKTIRESLKLLNPIELFRFGNITSKPVQEQLQSMAVVFFLNMLLYAGLECNLLFLAQLRFGYTGRDQGRIFLVTGVSMIIIQSGFVKRFKGGREAATSCWAMYIQALAYVIMGFANSEAIFYLGLVCFSFSSASFVPAFNGLASLCVGPQQQGQTMGTFRSMSGLSRAVGPSFIGALFWIFGPSMAFCIGAVATLCVSVMLKRIAFTSSSEMMSSSSSPPTTK